jgi:hypothetical protein
MELKRCIIMNNRTRWTSLIVVITLLSTIAPLVASLPAAHAHPAVDAASVRDGGRMPDFTGTGLAPSSRERLYRFQPVSPSHPQSAPQVAAAEAAPPQLVGYVWLAALTPTATTVAWETDVPSVGAVDYGLTASLGRTRPATPGPEVKVHYVELSPLKANTLYHFRVRSKSAAGESTFGPFTFRTPKADATAGLVVTTTNSNQTKLLKGACYQLSKDAGGGALGDFVAGSCDKYDRTPNDGRTEILGVKPGTYVLVETRSPNGYAIPKNRTVTLAAAQTAQVTVKNFTGGTRLSVVARDQNGVTILGACFEVWTDAGGGQFGTFVAEGCDVYDGNDGKTTLGGIRPGAYLLWQTIVPEGHVRAPVVPFTTVAGQTSKTIDLAKYTNTAPDNVVLNAVDGNGTRIWGACFGLYLNQGSGQLGDFVDSRCDGDDGWNDGRTIFTEIPPGSYVALEYWAPAGYVVGKKTTFTKAAGQARNLKVTQVAGGVKVTVTTLKGNTSQKLRGACYGVYRQVGGRWETMAFSCDGFDGANDGITRFAGLAPRKVLLGQTLTPAGYARPEAQIFTVGSSNISRTVRTYSGPSAASLDAGGSMPPTFEPPSGESTRLPTSSTRTVEPTASPTSEPTDVATPVPTEAPATEAPPTETATPEPTATDTPTETPVPTEETAPSDDTSGAASTDATPESGS